MRPDTSQLEPGGGEDRRKLETLLRIAKSLAVEIRLDSLLRLIVTEVTSAMQAERCTLFLVDPQQPGELVSRVAAPVEQEIRVRFGVGIAGATAAGREAINLADAYRDPRFNPKFDQATQFRTRSLLSMPILDQGGKLVGVVQVLNKHSGDFTAEDERFLDAICGHLGVALQRTEMIEAYLQTQMVTKSLEVAREIQRGCLPGDGTLPDCPEVDIYATLLPVFEVGGDLYDYFRLDEDHLCILMGDVSGKGIPAALFMVMARTAFKMSAVAAPRQIARALGQVNQFLFESNPQGLFVTALAGVLDLRTGELVYADAGHEPPYLVRSSGAAAKVEKVGGIVLGILPQREYETGTIQLQPGDTLILYTDGVSEAMSASGGLFGSAAALRALASAGPGASSQALVTGLVSAVRGFAAETRQSDDIAALAIQYRGRAGRAGR
ncbi:MAG TPA: GAF domain-containing SpoIIE family protein phosphatase [Terriglobales bacterium]|nr:GAF domain-containing SpoIIE family protein phosphatase [Terriglobales bacterium]